MDEKENFERKVVQKESHRYRLKDFVPIRGLIEYNNRNGINQDFFAISDRVKDKSANLYPYNAAVIVGAIYGAYQLYQAVF